MIYLYKGKVVTASNKEAIAMPSSKVKNWYMSNFHSDNDSRKMKDISFSNLWNGMKNKKDVYSLLGINDPDVRERVFKGIEQAMHLPEGAAAKMWNKNYVKNKEYSKLINRLKRGI
jgi:hypothetical protein